MLKFLQLYSLLSEGQEKSEPQLLEKHREVK